MISQSFPSRYDSEGQSASTAKWQDALFNINAESDMLREIKDILDELSIITLTKTQGLNTAIAFSEHVQLLLTDSNPGAFSMDDRSETRYLLLSESRMPHISVGRAVPNVPFHAPRPPEDVTLTLTACQILLKNIQDQILELRALKEAAEDVSLSLKDLLTLKQQ